MSHIRVCILLFFLLYSIFAAAKEIAQIMRPESEETLQVLWSFSQRYIDSTVNKTPVPPVKTAAKSTKKKGGMISPLKPARHNLLEKVSRDTPITNQLCLDEDKVGSVRFKKSNKSVGNQSSYLFYRGMHAFFQRLEQYLLPVSHARKNALRYLLDNVWWADNYFQSLYANQRPLIFEHEKNRVDYAQGVMLGEKILMEQNMYFSENNDIQSTDYILSGIKDALKKSIRLSPGALALAQQTAARQLQKARQDLIAREREKGQHFITQFSQQQSVHKDGKGDWYRIDREGRSIPDERSPIPMVVREMLTDGTVVNDMQAQHRILNISLQELPPAWRTAVKKAGYGGAATVISPPELAYGDNGLLPVVPPGATIVYMLRTFDPNNYGFTRRNNE